MSKLSAALALVVCLALAPPAYGDDSDVVRVAANRFDPFEVAVEPGGTVTWVVQEGGHTIVADDRRFVLRGEGGTTLPAGTTVSAAAGTADEYVGYFCEIHGGPGLQGMSARIRVGEPPRPPVVRTPVIRVPADHASIAGAVAAAAPGSRIEVAPGRYRVSETIVVGVDDVVITGVGTSPRDVVVAPAPGQRGFPDVAFRVTAFGATIRNLSVGRFRAAGIHLDGGGATTIADVMVDGSSLSLDGILVERAAGATLRRTTTTGARRAGVHIVDCAACGVLVADGRSRGNLVGVLTDGAAGVLLERMTIARNSVGLVARTAGASGPLRRAVVELRDSVIVDNTDRRPVATARPEDRPLAVGAGVWLSGARDSAVDSNDIHGNAYGVVLAGNASLRTRVTRNRLADNADADLAWDGLGGDTCFAGNGDSPTSEPPAIEALYPCGRVTAGVPFPVVSARLALRTVR